MKLYSTPRIYQPPKAVSFNVPPNQAVDISIGRYRCRAEIGDSGILCLTVEYGVMDRFVDINIHQDLRVTSIGN